MEKIHYYKQINTHVPKLCNVYKIENKKAVNVIIINSAYKSGKLSGPKKTSMQTC